MTRIITFPIITFPASSQVGNLSQIGNLSQVGNASYVISSDVVNLKRFSEADYAAHENGVAFAAQHLDLPSDLSLVSIDANAGALFSEPSLLNPPGTNIDYGRLDYSRLDYSRLALHQNAPEESGSVCAHDSTASAYSATSAYYERDARSAPAVACSRISPAVHEAVVVQKFGNAGLADHGRLVQVVLKHSPTGDWSNQELAELYRVEALLLQANIRLSSARGLTDEGEPWFVFSRDDGEVFVHIARINGVYVLASPALLSIGGMSSELLTGVNFSALANQFASALTKEAAVAEGEDGDAQTSPAPAKAEAQQGAKVLMFRPHMLRSGKVSLHPALMLPALVWALYTAFERSNVAQAKETVSTHILNAVAQDWPEGLDNHLSTGEASTQAATAEVKTFMPHSPNAQSVAAHKPEKVSLPFLFSGLPTGSLASTTTQSSVPVYAGLSAAAFAGLNIAAAGLTNHVVETTAYIEEKTNTLHLQGFIENKTSVHSPDYVERNGLSYSHSDEMFDKNFVNGGRQDLLTHISAHPSYANISLESLEKILLLSLADKMVQTPFLQVADLPSRDGLDSASLAHSQFDSQSAMESTPSLSMLIKHDDLKKVSLVADQTVQASIASYSNNPQNKNDDYNNISPIVHSENNIEQKESAIQDNSFKSYLIYIRDVLRSADKINNTSYVYEGLTEFIKNSYIQEGFDYNKLSKIIFEKINMNDVEKNNVYYSDPSKDKTTKNKNEASSSNKDIKSDSNIIIDDHLPMQDSANEQKLDSISNNKTNIYSEYDKKAQNITLEFLKKYAGVHVIESKNEIAFIDSSAVKLSSYDSSNNSDKIHIKSWQVTDNFIVTLIGKAQFFDDFL